MLNGKRGLLANFIGAFVIIAFGIAMYPVIKKQTTLASVNISAGSSATTLLNLMPTFFIGMVIIVGIGAAYSALRNSGLVGGYEPDSPRDPNDEIIDALKRGDNSEPVKAQTPKVKTKYDKHVEAIEQDIKSAQAKIKIKDVDYHGTNQIQTKKEADEFLNNFKDTSDSNKYSEKGRFD